MNKPMRSLFVAVLFAVAATYLYGCSSCNCGCSDEKKEAEDKGYVKMQPVRQAYDKKMLRAIQVADVIDGKTLILDDGEKVSMMNIELPEVGSDYWMKAKKMTEDLAKGKELSMMVCNLQPYDADGNTVAHVFLGVNSPRSIAEKLLEAGLAKVKVVPPCGADRITAYNRIMMQARSQMAGLWKDVVKSHRNEVKKKRKEAEENLAKWRDQVKYSVERVRKRNQHLDNLKLKRNFPTDLAQPVPEKKSGPQPLIPVRPQPLDDHEGLSAEPEPAMPLPGE